MAKSWSQEMAIQFCVLVEEIAPQFGAHVALTGGCLYKAEFNRKDCDIVLYRIRQKSIDDVGLLAALQEKLGVEVTKRVNNWLTKAKWNDRNIDIFWPEEGNDTTIWDEGGYDVE